MKNWILHLPRRRCPNCGIDLDAHFEGKYVVKVRGGNRRKQALRAKRKDDGETREGVSGGLHDAEEG